ncbi:MAG: class I mannose-6-phosphate isomerase [Opitutaceae bacterium]
MRKSNYDKFPTIEVSASADAAVSHWVNIASRLRQSLEHTATTRTVLVIECYPGVDESAVELALSEHLRPVLSLRASTALLPPAQIDALVAPFLGADDPVFGFLCGLQLPQFFDIERLEALRGRLKEVTNGLILVVGCGARLLAPGDVFVYADLARWEAQLRFRRQESGNLGVANQQLAAGLKYKRAYFVDWRVADRWKRPLLAQADFFLDTHQPAEPKLAEGAAIRRGWREAVASPFRVVPFFDPAPWGGQWMKEVCDLDRGARNYGWCFDCVPEENSLLLRCGSTIVELPSIDLVFDQPKALLGEAVHGRFGDEFPIRFDFLDTMGGGNLSFQVHPVTEYIQHHFGMHYTQDESYYLLAASPGASVYLGLKEGIDPHAMLDDLARAKAGGAPFQVDRYANRWPAKPHDHFLIPAGTVHCSGAESMVLEISATPYIFTFKLWDWSRVGLDGKPRHTHLDHGAANICWERTTSWTKRHLINAFSPVSSGEGWNEERTGLHQREYIETRRHRFTGTVPHHTQGGVQVLNLVAGEEAVVESPTGKFRPFIVHYAETFIVPAAVGAYTIRPHGPATGLECMTMKAFVRT